MTSNAQILDVIVKSIPAVALVGLLLFVRWLGKRSNSASESRRVSQAELLQKSIANVVKSFDGRVPVVDVKLRQTPRGFAGIKNDELWVFFLIDQEFEQSPRFAGVCEEFDAQMRRELLLSGYFENSHEVLSVLVMSPEKYNSPWYR